MRHKVDILHDAILEYLGEIRQEPLTDQFLLRQSGRIGKQQGTRLNLVRMEMELLDKLRSIYTLTKRIARDFVPGEVGINA